MLIASGNPLSPSHTTMQTSATPRFLISVRTESQNLAPSPPSPAQIPRMSRSPLTVTPIATYIGRFVTCPSRTFTCTASMNITGYTRSSGRFCHSVISPTTLSVMREIVSFDTDAP
ncbi:hypothetical protein WIMU106979_26745 [Williamsia muralis]